MRINVNLMRIRYGVAMHRIITIANEKGGVGKTTSAVFLAEAAADAGDRALLVDADRNGSAAQWSAVASEDGDGIRATTLSLQTKALPKELENLTSGGMFDRVVIDTPPNGAVPTAQAVGVADLVVIPLGPSPLEVGQLRPTLDVCERFGVPAVVLMVRCDRRTTSAKETGDALAEQGVPVLDVEIPQREDIRQSMGTRPSSGRIASYGYDVALKEIDSLISTVRGEQ